MTEAGDDRGDNTAWMSCRCYPDCVCLRACAPVPAADRQTDEERARAQRFPSVPPGDDIRAEHERFQQQQVDAHADAVMADLGAAITEFGELREAVARWFARFVMGDGDKFRSYHEVADDFLALPEMRALLDSAAKVKRVERELLALERHREAILDDTGEHDSFRALGVGEAIDCIRAALDKP